MINTHMNLSNKIKSILNRDIYFPTKKELTAIAALLGIATYLELEFLQPWDIYTLKSNYKNWILIGLGVLEFFVVMIAFTTPMVLHQKGKEENIVKLWKVILLFIFKIWVMGTAIDFCEMILFPDQDGFVFHFSWIPDKITNIFAMGLFPFFALILWAKNKHSTTKPAIPIKDTTAINTCIYVKNPQKGSNIKINTADIIYIKSDRNYIEIHYLEDDIKKKTIHRSSLSAIQEELPKDLFCRTHNSYIARLSLISAPYTIKSTYVVRINSSNDIILPVSRTYLKDVREALTT